MPTGNELDIELPAIWIKQSLSSPDPLWQSGGGWRADEWNEVQTASAALVAEFGKKMWSDVGVPDKPPFPYLMFEWLRNDRGGMAQFNLPRELTARKRVVYRVRRVENFSSGVGSWSPLRTTYDRLKRCLCGVGETPIRAGGVLLGRVVQTRWYDDFRQSYRSDTTEDLTLELGFDVEITFENNPVF